jgi:hypothetical protein
MSLTGFVYGFLWALLILVFTYKGKRWLQSAMGYAKLSNGRFWLLTLLVCVGGGIVGSVVPNPFRWNELWWALLIGALYEIVLTSIILLLTWKKTREQFGRLCKLGKIPPPLKRPDNHQEEKLWGSLRLGEGQEEKRRSYRLSFVEYFGLVLVAAGIMGDEE